MTLKLEYIKETKNKYVFSDTNSTKLIESLYISKEVLKNINYQQGNAILVELSTLEE